jgi:hypothetical protein
MVPSVAYLVFAYCTIDYFVVVLSCVQKMRDNNNASEMIVHLTRIGGMAR